MLNGQKLDQIQGLDTIYSFIGRGDASYRISFKTEGLQQLDYIMLQVHVQENIDNQLTIISSMSSR